MPGGPLVASFPVELTDQIMLATSSGQSIRVPVDQISFRSRSAGGVKVLIPHHMDLAMSEDVYLPRIEEMERAVHARVPGCTVITPERLKWYHMGLSVWA